MRFSIENNMTYTEYLQSVIKFRLKQFNGNIEAAADAMNMTAVVLKRHIEKFSIEVKRRKKKDD